MCATACASNSNATMIHPLLLARSFWMAFDCTNPGRGDSHQLVLLLLDSIQPASLSFRLQQGKRGLRTFARIQAQITKIVGYL